MSQEWNASTPFYVINKTKNELFELSIMKRELIDEITQLQNTSETGTGDRKSKLTGKDFDDFSREELMDYLAKAREEIIYLR